MGLKEMYPRKHIQEAAPVPEPHFHDKILDFEQMPSESETQWKGTE